MILCPKCGRVPSHKDTAFGLRLDCCGLWAWGEHPLADAETHAARRAAHAAFDPLWRNPRNRWSRSMAYRALAGELGIPVEQCHMKLMDKATALKVPALVSKISTWQEP